MRLPDPPLLVISDRRLARQPLEAIAAAVFAAGCRWFSLREKDLDPAQRLALLRRLVAIGAAHGATVMVHEDIAAAEASGAAGIHLPGRLSLAAFRSRLPPGALVGCSTHDAAELATAANAGADYATLSPIFPTPSKPGYGPALGLERLQAAVSLAAIPVIALGGIAAANAAACMRTGVAGIAVMGEVMAAGDPAAAVRALLAAIAPALAAGRSGRHIGEP